MPRPHGHHEHHHARGHAPLRVSDGEGCRLPPRALIRSASRVYTRVAAVTLRLGFCSVCFLFLFGCKHLTRPRGAARAEPQRDDDWSQWQDRAPGEPGASIGSSGRLFLLPGAPANRQDVRGWGGVVPAPSSPGLVCFHPIRGGDTRNCFSGRAGVVPGRERPGHWPSRPAWLPQPCSEGRSTEASRPPSAESVRLGCAAHLHGGPTPLARGAGGGSPRILLGLRMMQGRGTSRSPSSRVVEEWGRGHLQQEALLGQRGPWSPASGPGRPFLAWGLSARPGQHPLSVPVSRGLLVSGHSAYLKVKVCTVPLAGKNLLRCRSLKRHGFDPWVRKIPQ